MIAISLTFPAGRYHATPWGRHVNEGAVEWPPSPWRLLRALVAVWKRTLPHLAEAGMKPIFEALASAPPVFVLPPASTGHTRHYMPWHKNWKAEEPDKAKTLVFDAFIALDPEGAAVVATWPDAMLDEPQRDLLARLLANLGFLGRAESWCEARLLTDDQAAAALEDGDFHHAAPLDPEASADQRRELELVRTLCADPAEAFNDTHVIEIKTATQGRGKNKTSTETRQPVYEPNWHLCMETFRLHDQKWSDPPGSRWITYTRPRNCFEVKPVPRRPSRASASNPQVVRFALDSAVLPAVTDTLPVAESARCAIMCLYGRITESNGVRGKSAVLAGKDERDRRLTGHRHAYYLPTDEDGDGRLDHLTIYAADGFGPNERRAFERLSVIRRDRDDRYPLRVLRLGTWSSAQSHAQTSANQQSPLGPSRVWVSATPYLVSRHPKTRGPHKVDVRDPAARNAFLIADLIGQLRSQRPDLAQVIDHIRVVCSADNYGRFIIRAANGVKDGQRPLSPLQFKRFRRKSSDDGGRRLAGAFRLNFNKRVQGPIAVGHSSHFGLGLFMPK